RVRRAADAPRSGHRDRRGRCRSGGRGRAPLAQPGVARRGRGAARVVTATKAPYRTDLEHGGRWTSLRLGGREWLWQRADPARAGVAPGDAFVDAGGLEECVPTVR